MDRAAIIQADIDDLQAYIESLPYSITAGDLVTVISQPHLPAGIVLYTITDGDPPLAHVRCRMGNQVTHWRVPFKGLALVETRDLPHQGDLPESPLRLVEWYSTTRKLYHGDRQFTRESWANVQKSYGTIVWMLEDEQGHFYALPQERKPHENR